MDEDLIVKVERVSCDIVYFYQGGVDLAWLEQQPIPKLLRIQKEAIRISKEMNKNSGI